MSALDRKAPFAVLVHLSGDRRGESETLRGREIDLIREGSTVVTLAPRGHTYELRAAPGAEVYVNGESIDSLVLASGDVIEIGDAGTVFRFRLYPGARGPYKSMSEAFSDCLDCARFGGHGVVDRAAILLTGVPRELATQTRPFTRVVLLGALALALGVATMAWLGTRRLAEQLDSQIGRFSGLEALVEATESATFSRADFEAARAALESVLGDSLERVEALEELAGATERAIAAAAASVVFLQGSYGFVEPASGLPLRHAVDPSGRVVRLPGGGTAMTLTGEGPIVELFYTGTAFVASETGYLLTNRHVALPWNYDSAAQEVIGQGLEPQMQRLVGYLPGEAEPFAVELVGASDSSDVALLRCEAPTAAVLPLRLATDRPQAGDEVIVMGYPTGMRALMARAGEHFADELTANGPLDFWAVARQLAHGGFITPLSTRGIVGQLTVGAVVYDAATTSGGSGGPVLNLAGEVVAINAAIVPGFTGSNLGVPAAEAAKLLAAH